MERIIVDISSFNIEGDKMIHEFFRFLRQKAVEFTVTANRNDERDKKIVVRYCVSNRMGIIYEGNNLSYQDFELMYRNMRKMRID